MTQQHPLLRLVNSTSLVSQILVGLVFGILLALFAPEWAKTAGLLGSLFVGALKAVAPLLVFVLVMAAIIGHKQGQKTNIRPLLALYLFGTFSAAVVAVIASFLFPSNLHLVANTAEITPPGGITEVLQTLLFNVVTNPVKALITDLSHGVSAIVKAVIRCAPLGILGLVASTLAETGFDALFGYAQLLVVLIGCMLFIAFVVNPLIVFWKIKRNPYPLVLTCLKESGVTAFFTRSSAANIPVNMALCEKLRLPKDTYAVSIPLGATINMAGAAITITVLTMAAVHTLGMEVDLATAILLSVVATISACGASGVAGGSLLLIPLACSLFGISNDIAMQVVAVGFIIGVLQDSAETALNSSTDVLFTAAACMAEDESLLDAAPVPSREA